MKSFVFSGGEVHVKGTNASTSFTGHAIIDVTDYTMNGFMAVCLQAEILRRQGFTHIHLNYPYFPYARQDRVMEVDEPFWLKVFADMVNAQKFASVRIADPHSDVTPGLINNCLVIPQDVIAKQVIDSQWLTNPDVVFIAPDAGAYKKTTKIQPDDSRIGIGVKVRDLRDKGKIIASDVRLPFPERELKGRPCLIIDDICDGGRTFIELAKVLKEKKAGRIALYVTHGIFSKGFDELQQYIDVIFTTNSFKHESLPDFVKVNDYFYNPKDN